MADSLTAAKELCERAEERRGGQMARIALYDRYLAAYFQGQTPDTTMGGAALDNYSDGRPALRAPGENAASLKGGRASPNYIKPIIKDLVSIKGQWPSLSVPPASGSDPDQKRSVLIRRSLVQQHTQSSMVRQWQRGGFFASCLGDAVIALSNSGEAAELAAHGVAHGIRASAREGGEGLDRQRRRRQRAADSGDCDHDPARG